MTSPSLTFGSILLAFSPSLSILFLIASRKPQLVILAVCSAFAYLVSALLSSVVWLVTSAISGAIISDEKESGDEGGIGTLLELAIPGVLCQMIVRCLFVGGYFRVEGVIRRSVAKHEEDARAAAAVNNATTNGTSNGLSNRGDDATSENGDPGGDDAPTHAETVALQLQLNDFSCSLASGCGYALLHSLLLYGTLLASESGEANSYQEGAYAGGGGSTGYGGTLYQNSCGGMPSLVNGALVASMFSILDMMWMMLCFFGMRRRSSSLRNASAPTNGAVRSSGGGTAGALLNGLVCRGMADTVSGGNAAVLSVAITHFIAALAMAPNALNDGCKISLPCLGAVVLWVALLLRRVTTPTLGRFLPEDQRRRIQGMRLGLRDVDQGHHVE